MMWRPSLPRNGEKQVFPKTGRRKLPINDGEQVFRGIVGSKFCKELGEATSPKDLQLATFDTNAKLLRNCTKQVSEVKKRRRSSKQFLGASLSRNGGEPSPPSYLQEQASQLNMGNKSRKELCRAISQLKKASKSSKELWGASLLKNHREPSLPRECEEQVPNKMFGTSLPRNCAEQGSPKMNWASLQRDCGEQVAS